jgi:hypothetical protein
MVNTICHVINSVSLCPIIKKISYEVGVGRLIKVFNFKYFVLNETSNIIKFDSKSIEEIVVGYFSISKVYKVYILISRIVIEYVHIKFDKITNIVAKNGHLL